MAEYNETLHALVGDGAKKEKDITCFRLLEWATQQPELEEAFAVYSATMRREIACPLIDTCPAATESRKRGHRWPHEVTSGLPLFEAASA